MNRKIHGAQYSDWIDGRVERPAGAEPKKKDMTFIMSFFGNCVEKSCSPQVTDQTQTATQRQRSWFGKEEQQNECAPMKKTALLGGGAFAPLIRSAAENCTGAASPTPSMTITKGWSDQREWNPK